MTGTQPGEILFGKAAGEFFDQLRQHNNRDWFTSHRHEYDELIAEPLSHLLTTADRYGSGRVVRPNRDVRFSKDKSPYKTTASMWAGTLGGVYLSIDGSGLQVGGGLYDPARHQLERAREAIAEDPAAASSLTAVLRDLEEAGFELAGPDLTTAPRGYPRDHPWIRLLRLRHYAATIRLPLDATTDEINDGWTSTNPLNAWVERYVGTTTD